MSDPYLQDELRYTVEEFALLVHRTETYIVSQLRDGKIKGYQTCKGSAWRIPESELSKYWGDLYLKPQLLNDVIMELARLSKPEKKGKRNGRQSKRRV